jgi:uncharacterized membrane protein YfcA
MKTLTLALLIGIVAGLAGALLGIGGGLVMVPAFVFGLGLEQKNAVATSLAVIVVTAVVGTTNNFLHDLGLREGERLIDWRLVGITAVGAAVAAWFGSDLMRSLSNQHLTRIFGVLVIVVGVKMLWK